MTAAVALSDLVVGMSRRGTPLASETGLFIALQATEALLDEPMRVSAREVRISAEGDVSLGRGKALAEQPTVVSLATLIETVITPAPLPVRALIERARSGQVKSLPALRAEIEALLVPLNRSAARRVLGRLARELRRAAAATAATSATVAEAAPRDEPDDLDDESPEADEPVVPAPAPVRAAAPTPKRAAAPTPAALRTVPCAPPPATDTLPDGFKTHADACATISDATDTAPDGALLGEALRTADDRAWVDVDDGTEGVPNEEALAEAARASDAGDDRDAADAGDDADDDADAMVVKRGSGGAGAGITLCVLLALAGAAYAWHRTTTAASAASVAPVRH